MFFKKIVAPLFRITVHSLVHGLPDKKFTCALKQFIVDIHNCFCHVVTPQFRIKTHSITKKMYYVKALVLLRALQYWPKCAQF